VTYTATTSDVDQGDVVTVAWSFDDGGIAAGDQATHAFSEPGTHTATATATDSAGVTTSQAVTVEVQAVDVPVDVPPNPPVDVHDSTAPQTEITTHPKARTSKRKSVFEFSSSEPGSSFECTIDKGAPSACTSPFPVKVRARRKPHSLSVVAIDAAGNRDATPATFAWKVKRKRVSSF
jgi:PKD repeat protein